MRLLVQRYSALGDILILLPILKELKEQYPNAEIALVSRPFVRPLAEGLGIHFYPAHLNTEHKGLLGLSKLARAIHKDFKPDLIIDAHAVLRSQWLNRNFKFLGTKSFQINKDRRARKAFLNSGEPSQLKAMFQIHLDNFKAAGLGLNFNPKDIGRAPYSLDEANQNWWDSVRRDQNIGIAPGAKHRSKQWPRAHFVTALKELHGEGRRFFLFGGPDEIESLEQLGREAAIDFQIVAGKFDLDQELALMKGLDLFVAHDSSNMHMAAWAGCPLISIWGGTDPAAGFAPYGSQNRIVKLETQLDCQPCSIFGTSTCARGDWACLQSLSPALVVRTATNILES